MKALSGLSGLSAFASSITPPFTPLDLNPRTWLVGGPGNWFTDNTFSTQVVEHGIIPTWKDIGTGGAGYFTSSYTNTAENDGNWYTKLSHPSYEFFDNVGSNLNVSSITLFWSGIMHTPLARNPVFTIGNSGGEYIIIETNTYGGSGTDKWGMYMGSTTYESDLTQVGNQATSLIFRFNAMSGTINTIADLYINGVRATFGAGSNSFTTSTINSISLGGPYRGTDFNMDVYQAGIIGRAISNSEANQLGAYLAARGGGVWTPI